MVRGNFAAIPSFLGVMAARRRGTFLVSSAGPTTWGVPLASVSESTHQHRPTQPRSACAPNSAIAINTHRSAPCFYEEKITRRSHAPRFSLGYLAAKGSQGSGSLDPQRISGRPSSLNEVCYGGRPAPPPARPAAPLSSS